jgi:wyosine [tRNA(Phe)-imidazoG37] synthetase (radical SAM superfamily)
MDYIFGPVSSRRLGFSLGIDAVPKKWCSFDCLYCEVGPTTHKTIQVQPLVKAEAVLADLKKFLAAGATTDYITIGGSGEPTLNAELGELVAGIKSLTDTPVALLTNGSLFYEKGVRRAVKEVEVILPSLDAADEEIFRAVNRPHPSLSIQRIIRGLKELRQEYAGLIWLEVLIIEGINDPLPHIQRLHRVIEQIEPDRIQLNTAVRPGTEPWVAPLSSEKMEEIKSILGHKAEVVASFSCAEMQKPSLQAESRIVDLLRRRPCPEDEIARAVGVSAAQLAPILDRLARQGKIHCHVHGGKGFYRAT